MDTRRKRTRMRGEHDQCVYCGKNSGVGTRDHIPPRCFFPDPKPKDLITVPCCNKCNNEKSRLDQLMVLYLTSNTYVEDSPEAIMVNENQLRGFHRTRADKLRKRFLRNSKWVPQYSPQGLYFGHRLRLLYDTRSFDEFCGFLVKGYYYYIFGKRLDDSYGVMNHPVPFLDESDLQLIKDVFGPVIRRDADKAWTGIFSCKGLQAEGDEFCSAWVFRFYDRLDFACYTIPKSDIENFRAWLASEHGLE